MANNRLYFLIGLARSGKSTIAKNWINRTCVITSSNQMCRLTTTQQCNLPPRVVINGDAIRLALTGQRYNQLMESYVSSIKHTMIRAFLAEQYDVLVDGTHTTAKSILSLLKIDPDAQYLHVDTSADICTERAIATNQPDLIPVIKQMANNLEQLGDINTTIEKLRQQAKEHHWTRYANANNNNH